jgi:uncharacterized protein (TIRG00374 family)
MPGGSGLTTQASSSPTLAKRPAATDEPLISRPRRKWRSLFRPAALLAVGGLALYVLLPSLLSVFGSWRSLSDLDWPFGIFTAVCELLSLLCVWELDRIALGTDDRLAVVTAQLVGNAAGRILPGGGATATAMSAGVLGSAGIDTANAAAAFGATAAIRLATTLALPVVALPAILGGARVDHSLATAAYLGAAAFVLVLVVDALVMTTDRPLAVIGRAVQWVLNVTVRRRNRLADLPERLLDVRDFVRKMLGAGWRTALLTAVGTIGFDYLALLCALRAVGATPQPSLVLLAYTGAAVLALIPVTPGGLGFVEAGLVGTLKLAGVAASDALAATLLYRIVSFWFPLPAAAVAYALFRRREARREQSAARWQPDGRGVADADGRNATTEVDQHVEP